ncbi:hypothetical protein [Haloechinothrix halophila]|uniref:hypothetical protein n=1 Tax=Haloechinothrix halophila TaxID=1069073 RepID=UPI0004062655|nr:hypothetical protein [Haloechinothrix halophila]
MTLAAEHLTGWWVGYVIGAVVVLLVAALLILIILTVRRIAAVAEDATDALRLAQQRTEALWQLEATRTAATDILAGATEARHALGGGR